MNAIRVPAGATREAIDEKLWEFDENAYIPHQVAGDADDEVIAIHT